MECQICSSTDNVGRYWNKGGMRMCDECATDTPDKMSRAEFDKQYWGSDIGEVPERTRREFYSDYLVCMGSFSDYYEATTEPTWIQG